MSIDAELLADRRRLRRKLSFWRVLGVLALIAAVVVVGAPSRAARRSARRQTQIARVSVDGFIGGTAAHERPPQAGRRVAPVSGVVVSINSPGGTTTGAEELYRNIRELAAKKPLVAFVDGTAASGGYITAIAADHIVARETSLVGSIGVIFQYPELSELLAKLGVQVEEMKSARSRPSRARSSRRGRRPRGPAAGRQRHLRLVQAHRRGRRKLGDAELATVSTGASSTAARA